MTPRSASLPIVYAICLATLGVQTIAFAAPDPHQMEAQARELLRSRPPGFCTDPPNLAARVAPSDVETLCVQARDYASCEKLQKACEDYANRGKEPGWLQWLLEKFPFLKSVATALANVFGFLGRALVWLVWVLLGVVSAIAVYAIVRAIRRAKGQDKTSTPAASVATASLVAKQVADPSLDARDLFGTAESLVAQGAYGPALELFLAASLRSLSARGALLISKDRTNGEYVKACGDAEAARELRGIVRSVDGVQFGGVAPNVDIVTKVRQRALAILGSAGVLVVCLSMLACGSSRGSKPKFTNPFGHEALIELLRSAKIEAGELEVPLSSLRPLEAEDPVPTIFLDSDRTTLDEDAQSALFAWVRSGGSLVLAGGPRAWPKELEAKQTPVEFSDLRAIEDEDEGGSADARATVVRKYSLEWKGDGPTVITIGREAPYGLLGRYGRGSILGVASGEVFANAGLLRPGGAYIAGHLLDSLEPTEVRIVGEFQGTTPPSNPLSALLRAGLGFFLLHALIALLVFYYGEGRRITRPAATPPPARRDYSESLLASARLYEARQLSSHALAVFVRFAEERLWARAAYAKVGIPEYLASASGESVETCSQIWSRAQRAKSGDAHEGDELSVLHKLLELTHKALSV